jgi:DNA-binding GntR family transcriptional regulator
LPGTFIRLDETAAALGVSITPVREALRTLRGDGMVLLEPHRGHVVAPLSRRDIEDIFWLQATIAKELAAAAAERIADYEIAELERLNVELATTVATGEPQAIAAAEFAFHRSLNHTTGRIKLAWFLLHVARYVPPLIYAADPQWGVEAVENHRGLIAALRRRDVAEVVRLTGWQFDDGARRLTERLEETGIWS